MGRTQGFTLIELVIVIIILGILAVTAAPKFINMQADARVSTLNGLNGALQSANTLVYSEAALVGVEKMPTYNLQIAEGGRGDATHVAIAYGYLQNDIFSLKNALGIKLTDDSEWVIDTPIRADLTKPAIIYQLGSPYVAGSKDCHLEYTPAQSLGVLPAYVIKNADC